MVKNLAECVKSAILAMDRLKDAEYFPVYPALNIEAALNFALENLKKAEENCQCSFREAKGEVERALNAHRRKDERERGIAVAIARLKVIDEASRCGR